MSTLKDIARRVDLSVSTVAGILRGAPGFNQGTRDRVLKAAKDLRYRPDPMGRALRGGRSMTVGVLVGSLDPALLWTVQAIESAAREAGYQAYVLFSGDRRDPVSEEAIARLLARRVDGLIVHSLLPLPPGCCDLLRAVTRPLVFVNWAPPWAENWVPIRPEKAIRDAVAHLRSLGHREAVFMGIPDNIQYPRNVITPYRRACQHSGMRLLLDQEWLVNPAEGEDYLAAAYQVATRHIRQGDLPTALIMVDDEQALAVVAALADAGLSVPGDVSIVGYDDHPIARMVRPALTTLRQPGGVVGAAAFAMLHRLLLDPEAQVDPPGFDVELVVRQSTGPARRG